MHLRAVIFDYGEVLSQPANPTAHRNLLRVAGVPQEVFDKLYWDYRLDYDAGILNSSTYWEKIGAEAGTEFTSGQIQEMRALDARMWTDLNEPMVAWALEIKRAGFLIGILSNMGEGVHRAMRDSFTWLDQFDTHVWSYEVGMVKPDPAIYAEAVRRLRIQPAEALFIDNLEINVAGARDAGLRSVVFRDVDQLSQELREQGFDLP
ncbi:MAG TPA: HAD family phosphatase, partial [Acidobacteriaceae bacterium]